MTREEILKMPAGPEMDALVAESVMGWTEGVARTFGAYGRHPTRMGGVDHLGFGPVPRYSTQVGAAWEVVEKLKKHHTSFVLTYDVHYGSSGERTEQWRLGDPPACDSYACHEFGKEDLNTEPSPSESAPLAICRAALLATLEETSL